ncbi:[4Fe-4S] proteins maturation [Mortierella sp. GBA30]|nr:[4Fe-4S] proteins maturation [Mortierella sp. GBA30]
MPPCPNCISALPTTALLRSRQSLPLPFSKLFRTRSCAVSALSSPSFSHRTLTTYSTVTSRHRSLAASASLPRNILSNPLLLRQVRFNSSVATAEATPSNEAAAPSLKIHNPQVDETGKELTVDITDNAVKQLKHIASRDQNPLQALRITVDSGGCHGYQYLMDLTDAVNEDDVVFEKDGARVIIDTITLPMVSGSRIDFIEELIGSAFKVLANPHAAHSCGCDTSFEIKI